MWGERKKVGEDNKEERLGFLGGRKDRKRGELYANGG